jgi:hypothetical protein
VNGSEAEGKEDTISVLEKTWSILLENLPLLLLFAGEVYVSCTVFAVSHTCGCVY